MELLDMKTYVQYAEWHRSVTYAFPLAPNIRPLVEKSVQTLHYGGFVHCDLRNTSIMVNIDGQGELAVRIVDFDWAGIAGEARYPMNLNRVDLRRPDGARDGHLIMAEHDIEMIGITFQ